MHNRSNKIYLYENLVFLSILLFLFLFVPEFIINSSELPCILHDIIKINTENVLHSNILFYILSGLNINSIIFFGSILIATTYLFLFKIMCLKSNNIDLNLIILCLSFLGCLNFFELNRHTFSYPFIIGYIYILDLIFEGNYDKKNIAFLMILTLLWTNISYDFIFGLLIILIYSISYFLEKKFNLNNLYHITFKHIISLISLWFLITLINPAGLNIYFIILKFILSKMYEFYSIFSSPDFHNYTVYIVFELLILSLIFISNFSKSIIRVNKLILCGVFLLLSLFSSNNIVFFMIVSLPILAESITNDNNSYTSNNSLNIKPTLRSYLVLFFISITILILSLFKVLPDRSYLLSKYFPVEAINYSNKSMIKGNVLNAYGWNCYVKSTTGCNTIITEDIFKNNKQSIIDYIAIYNMDKTYQLILDKYKIDWILIPFNSALSVALLVNPNWKLTYNNHKSCIFVRAVKTYNK